MDITHAQSWKRFEKFIADTGDTYVFDDDTSVLGMGLLLDVMKDLGVNPMQTENLRAGMTQLFHIELCNAPDFEHGRFILTPNHVSDVDALVLGLLHPRIRIVSKDAWTDNAKLRQFLDIHFDLYPLTRTSVSSLRRLLTDSIRYLTEGDETRHYLVFSQGTISDFRHNSLERISPIAQKLSDKTDVPIVNVFVEQVSLHHPTRIVFDEPMRLSGQDDFRSVWLERERAMQQQLVPPARPPKLTHKHANNNKPGDPFF